MFSIMEGVLTLDLTILYKYDIEMTYSELDGTNEPPQSNTLLRKTLFLCLGQTVLWRHDEG